MKTLLLAVICSIATSALATGPAGFFGLKWGCTKAEAETVLAAAGVDVSKSSHLPHDSLPTWRYNGSHYFATANRTFLMFNENDQLIWVQLMFPKQTSNDLFDSLTRQFKTVFGSDNVDLTKQNLAKVNRANDSLWIRNKVAPNETVVYVFGKHNAPMRPS